jgi:hypothetical protein
VVEATVDSNLRPVLDVPATDGGYVSRETVRFAFFVRRRNLDVAPLALDAIERLVDLFPPPALTDFAIESGDWLTYDKQGLKDEVRKRLAGKDRPINNSVSLAGDQANIPDFAVEYSGRATDLPVFRTAACALWFSVARSAFPAYRDRALALAWQIFLLMGCSAAYVDIALEGDKRRLQAAANRYLNVDISSVDSVARDIEDKLPGVFWQNFIGQPLAAALGGASKLASILSADAQIKEDPSGGLLVRLGVEPTLGDVNRQENLADRIALARHAADLDLLHVPRRVTYFSEQGDLSGKEAQEQWHQRFVSRR